MTVAAKKRPASGWGQRLKAMRESKGLTQEEAARALEVPVSTIRNWEQGRTAPAPYVARLIMKLLDCQGR
jgi:DNA-binding transcriptional regulator YiaG